MTESWATAARLRTLNTRELRGDQERQLTAKYHVFIIGNKSNEGKIPYCD